MENTKTNTNDSTEDNKNNNIKNKAVKSKADKKEAIPNKPCNLYQEIAYRNVNYII